MADSDLRVSRTEASAAVEPIGWRLLLETLCASVPVGSLARAAEVAAAATGVCGEFADSHLRVDIRPDRVELSLQNRARGQVTGRDIELAHIITAGLSELGAAIATPVTCGCPRPVQMLEVAIDTMDRTAIMQFWKAVLGYVDQPGSGDPPDAIVDPAGQLPTIWFQQMDVPRPARNRIHFDITVSADEAGGRLQAALAAGGRLVYDAEAPAFWLLADAEGNEVCVCTWQGRDEVETGASAGAS